MLLNAQRAREIPDLVLLGFEVFVLLVGQNEAQSQESCLDERKLVFAAIPYVLLANGGIDLSRKQVIHPGILPIDLGRSVFISEEFSGKRIGTVSALGGGKIQILLCGEIARVSGDDVNEAGFGLGVAELCEGMDIVFGYFHGGWNLPGCEIQNRVKWSPRFRQVAKVLNLRASNWDFEPQCKT